MSRQRALARAERQAQAAAREAEARAALERAARRSGRRDLQTRWRQLRLWRHGPGFRRERWASLLSAAVLILAVVWTFSRSLGVVALVALVLVVAAPAVVVLTGRRRS